MAGNKLLSLSVFIAPLVAFPADIAPGAARIAHTAAEGNGAAARPLERPPVQAGTRVHRGDSMVAVAADNTAAVAVGNRVAGRAALCS